MKSRIIHGLPNGFYLEGEIHEAECGGAGNVQNPILWINVRIKAGLPQVAGRNGLFVRRINARLCLRQDGVIAETSREINLHVSGAYPSNAHREYLNFLLTPALLHEMEQQRNGGDMALRLDAVVVVDHVLDARNQDAPAFEPLWVLRQPYCLNFIEDFTIPRDTWITCVLPNAGYGKVHLVELPAVPITKSEVLKKSFDALLQAEQHHRAGRYDDAVGKCRVAVDDFVMLVDDDALGASRKILKLRRPEWEVKLGKAASAWLAAASDALKYGGNLAHHSPNPHYDQLESQMILNVTAALVNYAARCQPETIT